MSTANPPSRPPSPLLRTVLANVLVSGSYVVAGEVGLQLAVVRDQVTPLWPCTGIALVCLLWFGPRILSGIALGAFLVNITIGPSLVAVLVISAGNTLAPWAAYLLLRKAGFGTDLGRMRDALALIGFGVAAMVLSATIGTATLLGSEAIGSAAFWPTWSVWWTGDAMGVLVFAPVLLVLREPRPAWTGSPLRWLELGALLTGAVVSMTVALDRFPILFIAFPFLVWAALRFRHAGAAPTALTVSVLAVLTAAEGAGPFAGLDVAGTMITLQAFTGTVALTGLLLATAIKERDEAQRAVEETCQVLADAVDRMSGRDLELRTRTAVSQVLTAD